jgi:pyruvate dehydrogenase complex dehydrogenase (E1) component
MGKPQTPFFYHYSTFIKREFDDLWQAMGDEDEAGFTVGAT